MEFSIQIALRYRLQKHVKKQNKNVQIIFYPGKRVAGNIITLQIPVSMGVYTSSLGVLVQRSSEQWEVVGSPIH